MVVSLREWSGQGGACCPSQRCGAAPLGWAAHAGAAEGPAGPACVVGAVGEAVVRRLRDHVRKVQPLNDAVQWCSAEQCSAVQRSAAQRSGVQPCAELCRARHTACSAALAVTTAARNQTLHTLCSHAAPQSERLHSNVPGSFRRFCRAPRERGVSAAAARPFRTCTCAARQPAVSERSALSAGECAVSVECAAGWMDALGAARAAREPSRRHAACSRLKEGGRRGRGTQ